jgi:hypothetical protein
LTADCEWYRVCIDGEYETRKCPLGWKWQKQMYDPIANVCTDNVKLPIDGKCGSYKECSIIESVSMNGKWTEVACGSGQHFDQKSQKCIEAKDSTCSKCFSIVFFQVNFSNINEILCLSELKACDENKCQNGGKCQGIGTDEHSCLCPIGFTGKNCE